MGHNHTQTVTEAQQLIHVHVQTVWMHVDWPDINQNQMFITQWH